MGEQGRQGKEGLKVGGEDVDRTVISNLDHKIMHLPKGSA